MRRGLLTRRTLMFSQRKRVVLIRGPPTAILPRLQGGTPTPRGWCLRRKSSSVRQWRTEGTGSAGHWALLGERDRSGITTLLLL
jgi:hypothetical protein